MLQRYREQAATTSAITFDGVRRSARAKKDSLNGFIRRTMGSDSPSNPLVSPLAHPSPSTVPDAPDVVGMDEGTAQLVRHTASVEGLVTPRPSSTTRTRHRTSMSQVSFASDTPATPAASPIPSPSPVPVILEAQPAQVAQGPDAVASGDDGSAAALAAATALKPVQQQLEATTHITASELLLSEVRQSNAVLCGGTCVTWFLCCVPVLTTDEV